MALIYHYTTASGLLGMLQNCSQENPYLTMWATHALYLNDPSEYNYGKKVCRQILEEVEEELETPKEERISTLLEQNNLQKRIDSLELESSKNPQMIPWGIPYVFSLSRNYDTLPMWNTYAQKGNGVAIGFDEQELISAHNNLQIKECIYGTIGKEYANIRERIKEGYIKATTNNLFSNTLNERAKEKINDAKILFYINTLHKTIATYIKHESYAYEKEVRCSVEQADKIFFRESKGLIIPYIEHKINCSCIKKIIIGPTLDKERMKTSLHMLIRNKGIAELLPNDLIDISNIPYRD